MGLVDGAADMHNSKAFVDHGALAEKRIQSGKAKSATPQQQEEERKKETNLIEK